jgi:hypothetical protein
LIGASTGQFGAFLQHDRGFERSSDQYNNPNPGYHTN